MTTKILVKKLENLERQINNLRIQIYHAPRADRGLVTQQILRETAGALAHGRLPKNSLAWQRAQRKLWDRRTSRTSK